MTDKRAFEANVNNLAAAWKYGSQQDQDEARAAVLAAYTDLEERERMRLAGISTAALGYWKEGDSIHPDYDTVALRDVAKLYAKYDELYQARDAAAGREGHGIMPANLAHKLKAFAAEPEGTINWKMIAWSLHRMLNAKPFTHPAPKADAAADWPTIYQVAQARIAELHCALTNLYALVQGECPSLLENDHHDEMIRKALTGEQR